MPSQSTVNSFAFASGAIFTASVGYVFSRSSKLKSPSQVSLPFIMSTTSIPMQKKTPPLSPSALKNSFQKLKLFRLKCRRKSTPTVMIFPSKSVIDDDASSICSDSTSIYTVTDSAPNLPGTLSQAWESSTSTNGFSPRSISEKIEEEEEDMEWCNSDDEYVEPNRTRASLPIVAQISPRRKHNRCISLPPDLTSGSFYHHQRPSECWDDDNDFSIDDDLVVPTSLKEAQLSLRLNISTIRDFIHQIKELKDLRDRKLNLSDTVQSKTARKWKYGFTKSKFKKYSELEKKFELDWEKADVIIDLSDVAQDCEPTFAGGKSMEVDVERIPSERHMQVLKAMMEDTDPTFVDNDKENHCDCNLRSRCRKHKYYSDHGHNAKKQKLTDENNSGDRVKKKENFRIDVDVMPSLVEHLKSLQKRLSGHVDELESLVTLITFTSD